MMENYLDLQECWINIYPANSPLGPMGGCHATKEKANKVGKGRDFKRIGLLHVKLKPKAPAPLPVGKWEAMSGSWKDA